MREIAFLQGLFVNTSKTSNIEYRTVIKLFTRKALSAREINKELTDVYGHSASSYRTVAKEVVEPKDLTRPFEQAPRSGRPPAALTNESIRDVHKR